MFKEIIEWIAKQKYYFDVGITLLNVLNFALLIMANKDTLTEFTGFNTYSIILFSTFIAFLGMWFIGWLMSVLHFRKKQMEMAAYDHPVLMKILKEVESLKKQGENK